MKKYARIVGGQVAELFVTDGEIKELFHPSLVWADATQQPLVDIGWIFDGKAFKPPEVVQYPTPSPVTIAELQRQLAIISAQIDTLNIP